MNSFMHQVYPPVMKNILILLIFANISVFGNSQDTAYYLSQYNSETLKRVPINSRYFNGHHFSKEDKYQDSVLFDDKYYRISGTFYINTYPFNQSDYFDAYIYVEDIGMIYSMNENSRGFNEDFKMMLAVSDYKKQKLLKLAYLKLSETDHWFDWKRCAELTSIYKYETCAKELSKLWMRNRNDITLIKDSFSFDGNKVNFSGTIVNQSKEIYFFQEGAHFGPARSTETIKGACVTDSLKSPWGNSVMFLKADMVLKPGDTMVVSGQFFRKNIEVTYEGLQFYGSLSLAHLLFPNSYPLILEDQKKQYWHNGEVLKVVDSF